MIPDQHRVVEGEAVIVKASGLLVYAKCNCPSSKPLEHTVRYINRNKEMFELAKVPSKTTLLEKR